MSRPWLPNLSSLEQPQFGAEKVEGESGTFHCVKKQGRPQITNLNLQLEELEKGKKKKETSD